jgi:Tfp pilus assembly protein PilF
MKTTSKHLILILIVAGLALAGCSSGPEKKPDAKPVQKEAVAEESPQEEDVVDDEAITSQKAAAAFNAGIVQYKKGDENKSALTAAYRKFDEAIRFDENFAIAHYNQGVLHEKQGELQKALTKYLTAFQLDPTLDLAVVNAGVLLEMDGQEDEARRLYEEAINRNPEAAGPRVRLARMHHEEENYRDAALLAREALQFDATSIESYRLLSRLYAEKKRNNLVRLIALRGQKLSKDDPELLYSLSIVAMNEKDVAQARLLLQNVLDQDPGHIDAHLSLIDLAFENRDWKTATREIEYLLTRDPENATLYNQYGMALKGQGRFDDAKAAYENAILHDADLNTPRFNLAVLLLRHQNEPEQAEIILEQFLEMGEGSDKTAKKLLKESKMLIEAKAEEKRMMEEMRRMEAEAARLAEEEAVRAAEEEKARLAAEAAAKLEEEARAAAEKANPELAKEKNKKSKKRKYRKKKSKNKKARKPAKPVEDEGFFDD